LAASPFGPQDYGETRIRLARRPFSGAVAVGPIMDGRLARPEWASRGVEKLDGVRAGLTVRHVKRPASASSLGDRLDAGDTLGRPALPVSEPGRLVLVDEDTTALGRPVESQLAGDLVCERYEEAAPDAEPGHRDLRVARRGQRCRCVGRRLG